MTPEEWRDIKVIWGNALELAPADRAAYLESQQPAVRREIESLIRSGEENSAFLEVPCCGAPAPAVSSDAALIGKSFGPYQHGRALMAGGNPSTARRDFEEALAHGYRAAGVELGMLFSQPSYRMLDIPRAISLYVQAWNQGVAIAAYELGNLYEHGVSRAAGNNDHLLAPDEALAWSWYSKGAEVGEPNALARVAERDDGAIVSAEDPAKRNSYLLESFTHYAAAAERARRDDWPDDAWRNWRYHRASLARVLEREGMMQEVANAYDGVCRQSAPQPTLWERLASITS